MENYMLSDYSGVSHVTNKKQLVFPDQPFRDDFLATMRGVFFSAHFFGVAGPKKNLWRVWGGFIFLVLIAIEVGAIYKLIKLLMGLTVYSVGSRSVTARLAGTMFYAASFFSLVLSWRLSSSWPKISAVWTSVEKKLLQTVPADNTLKKKMIMVSVFMAVGAFFEHLLSILNAIDEFDTSPALLLQQYVLNSHGFILAPNPVVPSTSNTQTVPTATTSDNTEQTDYSVWIAVPVFFVSHIATILWGFQDLLIVLISMGLSSRYQRLNRCVAKIASYDKTETKWCAYTETLKVYTWRRIREAYVKQAVLVRKVDECIGGLILLSSSGNFYFVCLQLFLGITQGISGNYFKRLYYMVSLLWLIVRFCFVVLAAADVNVNSKKALRYLHDCNDLCYNTEIERLVKQLTKDFVALSGVGFFYIDRSMLLQIAAAIITYELVLIQFDGKAGSQNVDRTQELE